MRRVKYWFRSWRKINTVEAALSMGLTHRVNIYGDMINSANCRSFWVDEYGHVYRCESLYLKESELPKNIKQ